jgi:hypothetical protein
MTSPPRSPTTDLADSKAATTISIVDPDPDSELTESIHTEPLDQLGNKLRSWRRTRQRLRRRVPVASAGTDAGEDQDDSREAGEVKAAGHGNQAAEQHREDGSRRFVTEGMTRAGTGFDDHTRCKCCLRHVLRSSSSTATGPSKTFGGEIRIAGVDEDENDQGGGQCETMREIEALDSDLILSAGESRSFRGRWILWTCYGLRLMYHPDQSVSNLVQSTRFQLIAIVYVCSANPTPFPLPPSTSPAFNLMRPSHQPINLDQTHGRNRPHPPDPPQHPPSLLRPSTHLPLHLANDLRGPGKIYTPSSRDLGAGEGTVGEGSRRGEGKGGTLGKRSQGVGREVEEDHLYRDWDRSGTITE